MKTILSLLAALAMAGCVAPSGERWPINEQLDPVTEEPPDVVLTR